MSQQHDDPQAARDGHKQTRKKRFLFVCLFVCLLVFTSSAAWYYWPKPPAKLPAIDLAGADPEVAIAIEKARDEVNASPRSADTWGRLGMVLVAHQFYPEANACFAEAERLAPEEVRWPYLHGLTLLLSDGEAAVGRLRRAAELPAPRPAIKLLFAETLLMQGRFDEAEQVFGQVLRRDTQNTRAHLGLARCALERSDLPSTRSHLERCASDPFARKAAGLLLAEVHRRSGDATAAARELRRSEQMPDDQPWPDPLRDEVDRLRVGKQGRIENAERLLATGQLEAALAAFRQIVRNDPDWDVGWLRLGRVLTELGDFTGAEQALGGALRATPKSVEAHFRLGVVLFQQGRFVDAEEHFRSAIALKPDHALAHYNLGHSLARQTKAKDAIAAFREALRVRPAFAAAHSSLGELLSGEGDKSSAIDHLRRAVELNPDDAAAARLLEKLQPQPSR